MKKSGHFTYRRNKKKRFLLPDYIVVAPYISVLTSHNMEIKWQSINTLQRQKYFFVKQLIMEQFQVVTVQHQHHLIMINEDTFC